MRSPRPAREATRLTAPRLRQVLRLINDAGFGTLDPNYNKSRVADVGADGITRDCLGPDGLPRHYGVSEYGSSAPAGFRVLEPFLQALVGQEAPPDPGN